MLNDLCLFLNAFPEESLQYIKPKFGQFCSITQFEDYNITQIIMIPRFSRYLKCY